MTAPAFTDDNLYALPLRPVRPSPAAKVTGHIGVMAMAVAATVVIVALILAVGSSRDDASNARSALGNARSALGTAQAETAAAKGETLKAQAAAASSSTQAQAALAASAAASKQLTDLRAVAVRANACIDGILNIMDAMISSTYASTMRAFDKAGPLCQGLGPLLKGTGGSV